MTAPTTCRQGAFRTERQAKRRAWLIRDTGKILEPAHCDTCGGWHLRKPDKTKDQP